MLRVYFGDIDKQNFIGNSSVYFKHTYQEQWMDEPFTREIVADIDRSEIINAQTIHSPVLGDISPNQLSGGVKTLLLMKHFPKKIFNASLCGNNCAKWILQLSQEKDFTINLFHIMDFGSEPFIIKIMNAKNLFVHDMNEFIDAGAKYLREEVQ